MEGERITLEFPVEMLTGDGHITLVTTKDSEKWLGNPIVSSGKSLDEATRKFWVMAIMAAEYKDGRSRQLDKYKWFQKGDWNQRGGTWFTVMGIHVYFRYGKGMYGGWYVPFTKLNILTFNHWRKRKTA